MPVYRLLKATLSGIIGIALLSPSIALAQNHIVKIDAKRNTQKNPAMLYLRAGTYQVTPIGRAQGGDKVAWSVWGHTTCNKPSGCVRAIPTKFTGLHNNYYVMAEQLGTVTVNGRAIPQVSETPRDRLRSYYLIDGTTRAYEVNQPMVYANENSALANAQTSTFTMNQGGRVKFSLLDNSRITDNRGGMSLKITKINTTQ